MRKKHREKYVLAAESDMNGGDAGDGPRTWPMVGTTHLRGAVCSCWVTDSHLPAVQDRFDSKRFNAKERSVGLQKRPGACQHRRLDDVRDQVGQPREL